MHHPSPGLGVLESACSTPGWLVGITPSYTVAHNGGWFRALDRDVTAKGKN